MPSPKVLVVVFDGLRLDHATANRAPQIATFAAAGVTLPNTGAAFPSETRVQVTPSMTGHPPAGHGIMANAFHERRLGFDSPMDSPATARTATAQRVYGRVVAANPPRPVAHGRAAGVTRPNTCSAFLHERVVQWTTAMTGHRPSAGCIMADAFPHRRLGFDSAMDTADTALMATAERVYGRVIGAHHLSESLWGAGKRLAVVTTGKIGNARLLAGRAAELGQPVLSIWGEDRKSTRLNSSN